MKFVDEFRDPIAARHLIQKIRATAQQPWVLMEVCGGQTHSLLRHGIDSELAGTVELIHGPGCPVCVTGIRVIDRAQELAFRPNVILASFGDMLRVPGTGGSLLSAKSRGARVLTVYSPEDAVQYAARNPAQQIVFFAVGFETTAPATALAVLHAQKLGLSNFSLLAAHVRVLPAMELLMASPDNRVQAFLAAGHVCSITGWHQYQDFADRFGVPVVVTGFEPVDLLQGILECVTQLESGRAEVKNCYGRSVAETGNVVAQAIVDRVYEIDDRDWRGFGTITNGGYRLRQEFHEFDAERRFFADRHASQTVADARRVYLQNGDQSGTAASPPFSQPFASAEQRCKAGEVLSGRLKPCDCPEYGTNCTPDAPLGSPMVSSEGACAAYFRYRGLSVIRGIQ